MSGYGQFSPVAKAMEVLDERWTVLVVRELLAGSTHFNDLHRGVPRMSPALLSSRLKRLERAGVIVRSTGAHGPGYALTEKGTALAPVVEAIGVWGSRWMNPLTDDDLDPRFLLWELHRSIDSHALPDGTTVIELDLTNLPRHERRHWLVATRSHPVEIAETEPDAPPHVRLALSIRTAAEVLRGDLRWVDAIDRGLVTLSGSRAADVVSWLRSPAPAEVRW